VQPARAVLFSGLARCLLSLEEQLTAFFGELFYLKGYSLKPAFCPNFDFIVWRRNRLNEVELTRLRCKSWSCDYCARLNRDLWRLHLKKRIGKMGGEWWFVTVTSHEWKREQNASLANLRTGLDLLFKAMRRIWEGIEYVRVYELHTKGAFHAHLVISGLSERVVYRRGRNGVLVFKPSDAKGGKGWSLKTWFKKTCRRYKMGYMVDVQHIAGVAKTVNYITKYITKESQSFVVPGLRRIQTSQGIGAANPRKTGQGWQIAKYIWGTDVANRVVVDLNLKMRINPSYFDENYVYPHYDHS